LSPRPTRNRGELNDISWPRDELLEVALLLDRLSPDSHDVAGLENYCLKKRALVRELRRLAHWARQSA
jgi:hypothetical protein